MTLGHTCTFHYIAMDVTVTTRLGYLHDQIVEQHILIFCRQYVMTLISMMAVITLVPTLMDFAIHLKVEL